MPSVTMLGPGVLAVLWIVLTGTVRSSMHARLDFLTSVPVDLGVRFPQKALNYLWLRSSCAFSLLSWLSRHWSTVAAR